MHWAQSGAWALVLAAMTTAGCGGARGGSEDKGALDRAGFARWISETDVGYANLCYLGSKSGYDYFVNERPVDEGDYLRRQPMELTYFRMATADDDLFIRRPYSSEIDHAVRIDEVMVLPQDLQRYAAIAQGIGKPLRLFLAQVFPSTGQYLRISPAMDVVDGQAKIPVDCVEYENQDGQELLTLFITPMATAAGYLACRPGDLGSFHVFALDITRRDQGSEQEIPAGAVIVGITLRRKDGHRIEYGKVYRRDAFVAALPAIGLNSAFRITVHRSMTGEVVDPEGATAPAMTPAAPTPRPGT